jgi:hypothetical protein
MKRLDLSTLNLVVLIADSGSLTEAARRASLTLAVESADSSLRYDRDTKARVYATSWYWRS